MTLTSLLPLWEKWREAPARARRVDMARSLRHDQRHRPRTACILRNEAAREVWRSLAGELHQCGLLSVLDYAACSAYCNAGARQRIAEDAIEAARERGENTLTVKTKVGRARIH